MPKARVAITLRWYAWLLQVSTFSCFNSVNLNDDAYAQWEVEGPIHHH